MDILDRINHHLNRDTANYMKLSSFKLHIEEAIALLDRLDREEEEDRYPVGYERCHELMSQIFSEPGVGFVVDEKEDGTVSFYKHGDPEHSVRFKDYPSLNDKLENILLRQEAGENPLKLGAFVPNEEYRTWVDLVFSWVRP